MNIAEQFLQLARVEAVESVEMNEQDMLDVVESAIDQVHIQAQQRDITLRFEYDPEQEVWVLGNNELLERLVVNLLTNAVKYSHEGSSVDVKLYAQDNHVGCEVRDRGVGIPPEFQERLFDRFSRANTSGGARTRGAGMGCVSSRSSPSVMAGRCGSTVWKEKAADLPCCCRGLSSPDGGCPAGYHSVCGPDFRFGIRC